MYIYGDITNFHNCHNPRARPKSKLAKIRGKLDFAT